MFRLIGIRNGSVFEEFFNQRDSLIIQYENGDMCKSEFLEANFNSVQDSGIKPFSRVDSYEKGMYNYQYYNVLAKYYNMMSKEFKYDENFPEKFHEYREKTNFYYRKKDESTLKLLRYLEFEGVESYFISTESKFLNNKLFEVVLVNYDYAVFHSMNLRLLDVLREEKVFMEDKRKSVIDEYINERY